MVLALGSGAAIQAQEALTLEDALIIARENNGNVRAAFLDYEASKASVKTASAAFLPTVTPRFSREWSNTETFTGAGRGSFDSSNTSLALDANWQILDNGFRGLNVRRTEFSAEATELDALQTLRNTLFNVQSRFYDALRSQTLLDVEQRNVDRAKAILDETEARTAPPIEDLPRKDVYQARADYQNAIVSRLSAQNRVSTSEANLKAVLAWEGNQLPELTPPAGPAQFPQDLTLEDAVAEGLENRPNLIAFRKRESAQSLNLDLAKLDAGVQYSLDANFTRAFADDPFRRTALVFSASFPLYDGERTKENTRIQELNLESLRTSLAQAELDAKAEIESAYLELSQNLERLAAAKVALEAAQINYDLTQEAYSQYRAATLVERLTAQVTLTTAESNLVEATYDTLISEARLRLVTGRSLPGE